MTAYITELRAITAQLTGTPEFAHETVHMMNIVADQKTLPVVFAPFLAIGNFRISGANIMPKQKIYILFLQQTQFENDITNNQIILEAMYNLAIEFCQRLNSSTVILPVRDAQGAWEAETEYVETKFDANFSGIQISFDAKLKNPYSICPAIAP